VYGGRVGVIVDGRGLIDVLTEGFVEDVFGIAGSLN
jgi:hypothetical protein